MPGTRRKKESVIDEHFEFLIAAPTWMGPLVASVVFAACRWGTPWALSASAANDAAAKTMTPLLSRLSVQLSPLLGGGVLFLWIIAEIKKRSARQRLERQSGLDSVGALDWREFESLLSEAFRRQGFVVEHSGKACPDGGIDQRLQKAGATTLVQCKHWKQRQVGVKVVRELLGVVSSEGAQSGIVITTGTFTPDAIEFASRNPIRLIEGRELIAMLREVQNSGRIQGTSSPPPPPNPPAPPVAKAGDLKCPSAAPKWSAEWLNRVSMRDRSSLAAHAIRHAGAFATWQPEIRETHAWNSASPTPSPTASPVSPAMSRRRSRRRRSICN